MKAKLVKKYGEFMLLKDNIIIASSDKNFNGDLYLSLSNCQAIEHGYDLKELADEYANVEGDYDEHYGHVGFKAGFQKAVDLVGDNKFSRGDMAYIMSMMQISHGLSFDEAITKFESLRSKEWDVEIKMSTEENLKSVSNDWGKLGKPKVDANGCLILKRI